MANSLIYHDKNHISIDQLQKVEDQILQNNIRNLPAPPSPLIKPYLREVSFSHLALVGSGCKFDPTLASALVERWRPETRNFHLSCGKCTITLEDVQSQLRLPMDRFIMTKTVHADDWKAVCDKLLGLVPETIFGGQIEMDLLRRNFDALDQDLTEVKREQHTRSYILMIIGGILLPDKS
ncbi:protein MAINTENANCE OF MERISTEMS [Gossypium hirsutum]|uniref:Protein MAINTENANCE OF MERISTEMS n=1 Tax=Gossypium hirsutum TaxID=3635 RepID=A0A1U8J3R7_GOSHI|nr:protein MAINTENANCE OF MERISTEMS-like [Gossypium hirsutum]